MSQTPKINMNMIKAAMVGKESAFLSRMGISSGALSGKHQSCPACGGKDRFRWDKSGKVFHCSGGGGQSGGDGHYRNGNWIDLLVHKGDTVQTIREMAIDWLGLGDASDSNLEKQKAKIALQTNKLEKERQVIKTRSAFYNEADSIFTDIYFDFKAKEMQGRIDFRETILARELMMLIVKTYKPYITVKEVTTHSTKLPVDMQRNIYFQAMDALMEKLRISAYEYKELGFVCIDEIKIVQTMLVTLIARYQAFSHLK